MSPCVCFVACTQAFEVQYRVHFWVWLCSVTMTSHVVPLCTVTSLESCMHAVLIQIGLWSMTGWKPAISLIGNSNPWHLCNLAIDTANAAAEYCGPLSDITHWYPLTGKDRLDITLNAVVVVSVATSINLE